MIRDILQIKIHDLMLDFLKDDFYILVNVTSCRNDTAVVIDLQRKETRRLQKDFI